MADRDSTLTCKQCGYEFARPGKRGRVPSTCGACKLEARRERDRNKYKKAKPEERECRHCGNAFQGIGRRAYCSDSCKEERRKARDKAKGFIGTSECMTCGREFRYRSRDKGKYCSRHCWQQSDEHRDAARERRAEQYRRRLDKTLKDNEGAFSAVNDRKCIECGAEFTLGRTTSPFLCGPGCRGQYEDRHKTWRFRMMGGQPLTQLKICPETGHIFKPHNNSQVYATKQIAARVMKRTAKAKRRAMKRTNGRCESIDPIAVFRYAKYICHICKESTLPEKRGTIHPKAPELDHILPLSQGGTHTWGNVATACRECNHQKSNEIPKSHSQRQSLLEL